MLSPLLVHEFVMRRHAVLLPLTKDAGVIAAVAEEFRFWTTTRLGRKQESVHSAWNAWTRASPGHPGWADPGWERGLPRHPRQVACWSGVAPPPRGSTE